MSKIFKYTMFLAYSFIFSISSLQANWNLPPIEVSIPPLISNNADVAIDSAGNSVAVWVDGTLPDGIVSAATLAYGSNTWVQSNIFSNPLENILNPQVVIDPFGNSVAIWLNFDQNAIQGATLAAGSTIWSIPQNISDAGQSIFSQQIAIDSFGNAVAVWTRNDGSVFVIQESSLSAQSNTWSTPTNISLTGLNNNADLVQVAKDPSGNAVAVWTRYDDNNLIIQGSKGIIQFDGTLIWTATNDLSIIGFDSTNPQVKMDAAGNAVAVWILFNGTHYIAQGATLPAAGLNWSSTNNLSLPGFNAISPQLATNFDGNTVAIWEYSDGSIIQGADLPPNSLTWIPTTNLSSALLQATAPQIGIDSHGNAVAIWQSSNGGPTSTIQSAILSSNNLFTWSVPTVISTVAENSFAPQIAVNEAGNVVTVFNALNTIKSSTNTITNLDTSTVAANPLNVLANGTSITTITITLLNGNNQPVVGNTVSLAPSSGSSIISPPSGISNGSGIVTFTVKNSNAETITYTATDVTNNIILNQTTQVTFLPNAILPIGPKQFKGTVKKNRFLKKTEYRHALTWVPSPDPTLVGYRIYEGETLLFEVPANGPYSVVIHNRKKKKIYTYTLVAFNANNVNSIPLFLRI